MQQQHQLQQLQSIWKAHAKFKSTFDLAPKTSYTHTHTHTRHHRMAVTVTNMQQQQQ